MPPSAADLRGRFTGRRVIVEPLAAEHEEGLVQAAVDAEMFRWMPVDMASSRDALRLGGDDAGGGAGGPRGAVHDPATPARVACSAPRGFSTLRLEHLRAEIGWTWVTRGAWGTGANVETKLLLLGHAFEQVGLRRVEFKTDARNERSRGALLALGAQFEGIFRKHMVVRDGGARDSAYYAVIDDDWPAVKRRTCEQRLGGRRLPAHERPIRRGHPGRRPGRRARRLCAARAGTEGAAGGA